MKRTDDRPSPEADFEEIPEAQHESAPVEPAEIAEPGGATRKVRRRIDARLWNEFSPGQAEAALSIAAAVEALSGALGFATADWLRIPGNRTPTGENDRAARLIAAWKRWAEAAGKAGILCGPIVDILVFAQPMRALDRGHGRRSGWAKANLLKGLDLYQALRAEPRPRGRPRRRWPGAGAG